GSSIIRAEQGNGIASAVVLGMSHQLHAILVIANTETETSWFFADGLEVAVLIEATSIGQRPNALFREEVVELEFSNFDVQPTAAQQIIEACPNSFEVECAGIVGRRQHVERNVLCQGAGGMKVQPRPIESVGRNPCFHLASKGARRIVD